MRIAWALAAVLAAGCAGKMPMTADEFRQMVPGAFMVGVQNFEVKRSLRELSDTSAGARARELEFAGLSAWRR